MFSALICAKFKNFFTFSIESSYIVCHNKCLYDFTINMLVKSPKYCHNLIMYDWPLFKSVSRTFNKT